MKPRISGLRTAWMILVAVSLPLKVTPATIGFAQTNLVSDIGGVAAQTDPNLVNPWGIAFGPTSPAWISDNGTGVSTIYNGSGGTVLAAKTIPPAPGGSPPAAPTGVVFNSTASSFMGDHFIFATEDGTIAGWGGGASAAVRVDNSGSGAIYKGVAEATAGSANRLFAANFHAGTVDVFDQNYAPVSLGGSAFVDPTIPAGFAPFNIQNIGGNLYVTYAMQDANKKDDVSGAGHGFIDIFDTNGVLQHRLVSNGPLNSPWGMALAPSDFGPFSNALLVGNFGDGTIHAFDAGTGLLMGVLSGPNGIAITNQGLWGLSFGNGAFGFNRDALYFNAGIPGGGAVEDHGLFGRIQATPEPASLTFMLLALAMGVPFLRHSRQ